MLFVEGRIERRRKAEVLITTCLVFFFAMSAYAYTFASVSCDLHCMIIKSPVSIIEKKKNLAYRDDNLEDRSEFTRHARRTWFPALHSCRSYSNALLLTYTCTTSHSVGTNNAGPLYYSYGNQITVESIVVYERSQENT